MDEKIDGRRNVPHLPEPTGASSKPELSRLMRDCVEYGTGIC